MFVSAKLNPGPNQKPKQAVAVAVDVEGFKRRAKNLRERFEAPRKEALKQEVAFAKDFVKQIIPVEVSIDKEAEGLKRIIPIKVTVLAVQELDNDQSASPQPQPEYENGTNPAVLLDE